MRDTALTQRVITLLRAPSVRVAALYLTLTVILTYPLSIHPWATTVPGSSDRNLYAWTLAWDAHALVHQPVRIFDANIFHPYQRTLAYSENLIGAAMLVAPVQWVVQDPFLTLNLAALVTVPLCAFGAYLLGRRLGLSVSAAWICGLVFGFAPPRFLRIDQMHLTAVEWIPFSLAYAHAYRSSGRAFDLRLALAFLSLQVLTSGHGAVFLLAALAGLVVYQVATGGRLRLGQCLRDAGVPGAVLLLPAVLMLIPYRQVQLEVGLRRELGDWTGSWASFLSSPTHVDAFLLDHLGTFGAWVNSETQAYLFPGVFPLVLSVTAFLTRGGSQHSPGSTPRRWWRRLALVLELACVAAGALGAYVLVTGSKRLVLLGVSLSFRQPWRLWGIIAALAGLRLAISKRAPFAFGARLATVARARLSLHNDQRVFYLLVLLACALLAIGPPSGPWRFLYWLPGLSFIRVPSRFMILGTLGVAVLAAFGFARLVRHASSRTRSLATIAVTLALVGEFAAVPFGVVDTPREIPAADRWLATQPTPFVVAELPLMDPTIPMLHSTVHWQKTVHGYSGWNPALSQDVVAALATVPDTAGLDMLARVGVTFLVVHASMYPPGQWQALEPRLTDARARLTLRYSDAVSRVYQLAPASATP